MTRDFKVSISSILAVLIFLTQFVSFSYFTWYNLLRYGTIIAVGIYVFSRYRIIIQKKYIAVNIIAFLFGFLTVYTSYLNKSRGAKRDPFLSAIVFCASFILFLFYMEIMSENNMVRKTINVFWRAAIIVTAVTDILIFFAPSLFDSWHVYLVGTKFGVVYLHFLLIVFYLARINFDTMSLHNKVTAFLLAVWTFFIGIRVNCSTGIIGIFILLALFILLNDREEFFLNRWLYFISQAACFAFVFFYELVLGNPNVQNFIVDVLGRDVTLTYRTVIYEKVPIILTSHNAWIQGLGYGSSYELGMKYGGLSDTQNGILEWIWQVGIPTTVVMVAMFGAILFTSKRYLREDNRKVLLPLLAGLYLMTILGTVEITISQMYFALAVCILGVATEYEGYHENDCDEFLPGELSDKEF